MPEEPRLVSETLGERVPHEDPEEVRNAALAVARRRRAEHQQDFPVVERLWKETAIFQSALARFHRRCLSSDEAWCKPRMDSGLAPPPIERGEVRDVAVSLTALLSRKQREMQANHGDLPQGGRPPKRAQNFRIGLMATAGVPMKMIAAEEKLPVRTASVRAHNVRKRAMLTKEGKKKRKKG